MKYKYDSSDNLVDLIEDSTDKFKDRPLFGTPDEKGEYSWITYREFKRLVDDLRSALNRKGIQKDDAIGVIIGNSIVFAQVAFASYGLCARFVPMYEQELMHTWKYIINDAEIKVLFVRNKEIYEQIMQYKDELLCLEKVFIIEGDGENSLKALLQKDVLPFVKPLRPLPDDIAALIYTSGTTARPKGVLLSHGNFSTNFKTGGALFPNELGPESRSLSILPWAHSFGQTAELYNFIYIGGSIGFIRNVQTIGADIKKVKPTFLIAVPRIFNKIYNNLLAKIDEKNGIAKKLFDMGIESAQKKREQEAKKEKPSFITNLKYFIGEKVVFKKIRQEFGGKLEGALTASATMNSKISYFFTDIKIPVYDCYGLTETSPAVTLNSPTENRVKSVGKPIKDVRVVIDKSGGQDNDEGEIIVFGPNLMQGYHKKETETKKVMTKDGGFRTGDCGRLDKDGFLYITGRFKEQYKLSNGKYVFPNAIEEEIKLLPLVENAVVYGEQRDFNICLIVPDYQVIKSFAQKHNLPQDKKAFVEDKRTKTLFHDMITEFLKNKFTNYEIPKEFIIIEESFTLENLMLTQTMKLKRTKVFEKYMSTIETCYSK